MAEVAKEKAKTLVSQMSLAEKLSQMQYDAPSIERLGIPAYNWWNECLHGVGRSGCATVFPQPIAMAASFDTELLKKVAQAIAKEARAKYNAYKGFGDTGIYQGLTFWSPNINLFRDPRWGRGHETYGESPWLTALMGTAFVKGLQGTGPVRCVDASLKHYFAHSGPENGRHGFNVELTDKEEEDYYLFAFRYCIEHAHPAAVMGAYNAIGGEPLCASKTYLKELLLTELAFEGYVVSDCGAICDINEFHHLTLNAAESAAIAVNNGCHLNCGTAYQRLKVALAKKLVSEETITEAVERLFTARYALGMGEKTAFDEISLDVLESPEHKALNYTMASESMILLKNDGILPLKKGLRIAFIGPLCDNKAVLMGNYEGVATESTSLLQGLIKGADEHGSSLRYAYGSEILEKGDPSWQWQPLREAIIRAEESDVVILALGLTPQIEGEEGDAYNSALGGDKPDLELPPAQKELYEAIEALGKPMVFLSVSGSAMNLSRQHENCNAVMQVFYPGAEGGRALSDILFGKISPTGRLPVTFYRSTEGLPDFTDYHPKKRTKEALKDSIVYPFAHGLTYSDIEEHWADNRLSLANHGPYDLSYTAVYEDENGLQDFKKVNIKAGETKTLEFLKEYSRISRSYRRT